MKLELEIPDYEWHPYITSFDPGGTTGWISFEEGKFYGGQFTQEYHHLELLDFLDAELSYAQTQGREFIVVCESFEFRQNSENPEEDRKGLELVSCEYIGVIRAWCMTNRVKFITQTAGEGKGFISNRKIQRLGLTAAHGAITDPKVKHMWDAFRHIAHYMTVRLRIREGLIDKMKRPREADEYV